MALSVSVVLCFVIQGCKHVSSNCGTISECCPMFGYLRMEACEQLSHPYQWELSHVWLSKDVNMPAVVALISVRVVLCLSLISVRVVLCLTLL